MVRILSDGESRDMRDKRAYIFRCGNCDDLVAAKRDTVSYVSKLCSDCFTIQGS